MHFAFFKGDKSLAELVARLFHLEGPAAKDVAKKAEESLLQANPHLADLGTLAPGSKIIVPSGSPPLKENPVPTHLLLQSDAVSAGLARLQAGRVINPVRSKYSICLSQ